MGDHVARGIAPQAARNPVQTAERGASLPYGFCGCIRSVALK
jgi:hypothetical protein